MSIQIIPLATVQKLRQHLQTILALPESENFPKPWDTLEENDDLPEPESLDQLGNLFSFAGLSERETPIPNTEGRWFLSVVNPGAALIKLPGLQLKPGWRLVSYLYRQGENGSGAIWAVPEDQSTTADLENALNKSGDEALPPHPVGALSHFMEAVEGDRSLPSFLIASLLYRELQEFGRSGTQANWLHHRLIENPPPQARWQWQTEMPKDFSPKVRLFPDGKAAVEFFSCRVSAPVALYRHVDQYPAQGYHLKSMDKAIATPIRPHSAK